MVTAVIPVKALSEAKSRLGSVLDPERRQELVLEMLKNVLSAVRRSRVRKLLVVTCDPTVWPRIVEVGTRPIGAHVLVIV